MTKSTLTHTPHRSASLVVQNGDLSEIKRAGAGFAAGITEALIIVTPFEVVKIKLQQQKGTSKELLRYKVGNVLQAGVTPHDWKSSVHVTLPCFTQACHAHIL